MAGADTGAKLERLGDWDVDCFGHERRLLDAELGDASHDPVASPPA